jgi:hypothetical protein
VVNRKRGKYPLPEGWTNETHQMLVDGIRGVLGLAPLYEADPRRSDTERFGKTHPGWGYMGGKKSDGRTGY